MHGAAPYTHKISFRVIDPTGEIILKKKAKEFIFDFTSAVKGKYTFEFINIKVYIFNVFNIYPK